MATRRKIKDILVDKSLKNKAFIHWKKIKEIRDILEGLKNYALKKKYLNKLKAEVERKKCTFLVAGKAGSGKYCLKNNNAERIEDQVTIVNKEDVSCSYGLQYLNSFAKASSLSNVVTLHISAKYPLMIDYEIEDLGFLKFYLAPKMDEDEVSNDADK